MERMWFMFLVAAARAVTLPERQITYKNNIFSLYKSGSQIDDITSAVKYCSSLGQEVAQGLPAAQLTGVTTLTSHNINAWIKDCYNRMEWVNGIRDNSYRKSFGGNRCMRFRISSDGKVLGPDVTSCSAEESFSLCARPKNATLLLNERVFTVNISANFSAGRWLCESHGGDLLILDNFINDASKLRIQPAVSGNYWIGLRGRKLCASDAWLRKDDKTYKSRRTDALNYVVCSKDIHASTTENTAGTSKKNNLLTNVWPAVTTAGGIVVTSELTSKAETTTKIMSTTKLGTLFSEMSTQVTSAGTATQKQTKTLETIGSDGGNHFGESTTPARTQQSHSSLRLTSTHKAPTSTPSHSTSSLDKSKEKATLPIINGTLDDSENSEDSRNAGESTSDDNTALYAVCGAFAAFVLIVTVIAVLIWKKRSAMKAPDKKTGWELTSIENPSYHRKPEKQGTIPIRPGAMQSDKHEDQVPPLPAPRNSTGVDPRDYNAIYSVVPNEYDKVELFESEDTDDGLYYAAGEYADCNRNTTAEKHQRLETNDENNSDDVYDECVPVSSAASDRKISSHYIEALAKPQTENESDTESVHIGHTYDMPPEAHSKLDVAQDYEVVANGPKSRQSQAALYHDLEKSEPAYYSTANTVTSEQVNADLYDDCELVKIQSIDTVKTESSQRQFSTDPKKEQPDATYDMPPEEIDKTPNQIYHELETETYTVGHVYHDLEEDKSAYYSTAAGDRDEKPQDYTTDIYDECEPVRPENCKLIHQDPSPYDTAADVI